MFFFYKLLLRYGYLGRCVFPGPYRVRRGGRRDGYMDESDYYVKLEYPCACPHIIRPVCGEDGNTYGNKCRAGCNNVRNVSV